MNTLEKLLDSVPSIEKRLSYTFNDKQHLILAFTHRSFLNESHDTCKEHNERLEFLGDSIFGFLVSDYLFSQCPQRPEGQLSHLRSHLVNATCCAKYMQSLEIPVHDYLLMSRGELMNVGRGRVSILANLFEAILGAIYLDGGVESVRNFLFTHFREKMDDVITEPVRNWKADLQDYSQKKFQQAPEYLVLDETGPDHNKLFLIGVYIAGKEIGKGEGASKKEAQQAAAYAAFKNIS